MNRLAHRVYKPDQRLRVTIKDLQKRVKALSDKLRRPAIKKTLILSRGFKKKGAKLAPFSMIDYVFVIEIEISI